MVEGKELFQAVVLENLVRESNYARCRNLHNLDQILHRKCKNLGQILNTPSN